MTECLAEGTLHSYFDGELSSVAAERAAAHLAACVTCTAAAHKVQSELSLLATALQPEFEVSVPTERLRARIDKAIAELQLDKPRRAYRVPNLVSTRSGWFNFLSAGSRPRAFSYAAVASLLFAAVVLGVLYLERRAETPRVEIATNHNPLQGSSPASTLNVLPSPGAGKSVVRSSGGAIVPAPKKTLPRQATRENENTRLLPGEQGYITTIAALDATIKSNARPMRPGLQVEYQHNLAVVDQAIAATRAAVKKNPKDPDAAQFLNSAYQSKVDLMTQIADARLFNAQRK